MREDRYKIWDYDANGDYVEIDMPERMKVFLDEIHSVCVRHGLSISHEDGHGAFIIKDYDERNIDWLFNANKHYKDNKDDLSWLENLSI